MSSSPYPNIPAIGFLSEVSDDDRAFLTGFGKFLRTSVGEQIITEGQAQESLFLILSGTLHVVTNVDGRDVLIAAVSKGDSLGEVNLFDPDSASASVISRGDCLIWTLARSELEGLFAADPAVGNSFMKGLLKQAALRIRKMNEKLMTYEKVGYPSFLNQIEE